jgi:hypothetical protein
MLTTEFFFKVRDSKIEGAWNEKYSSEDKSVSFLSGKQTKKTALIYGWDDTNTLTLATITPNRPNMETNLASYATIISRTFDESSTPFTMTDKLYMWTQQSPDSFWDFTKIGLSDPKGFV